MPLLRYFMDILSLSTNASRRLQSMCPETFWEIKNVNRETRLSCLVWMSTKRKRSTRYQR